MDIEKKLSKQHADIVSEIAASALPVESRCEMYAINDILRQYTQLILTAIEAAKKEGELPY